MIQLETSKARFEGFDDSPENFVARVSSNASLPMPLRADQLYLGNEAPPGFLGSVCATGAAIQTLAVGRNRIELPPELLYLSDGDVVRAEPKKGKLRALYRSATANNTLMLTERCNNLCLMCSQPPKNVDDSWRIDEAIQVLKLAGRHTPEIILSGGEPSMLGDGLIRILRTARSHLPETAIHVLSNGRGFTDDELCRQYADVRHPDVMIGIPLYSDLSDLHDYVVQADGAFDETIRGILNLKRFGQRVEIRVVLHAQTIERLPDLARFISRNLTFVDHVALMGLEMTGFTLANLGELWIDPWDYQDQLADAVHQLDSARIRTSIYNHQLCTISRNLWPFARRSISDWKNEYLAECDACAVRSECGGFFSTATRRRSRHIRPVSESEQ